jgi:hypothetical protein
MTALVFFVEQVALGLYILVGIGILLSFRGWLRSNRDLRATHFELEREIYRYRRANAITALVLLIEGILIILGLQQVVAPAIRHGTTDTANDSSTAIVEPPFFTPTPAPVAFGQVPIDRGSVNLGGEEIVRVQVTPTLTPTPVGTLLPNPPPITGCDRPGATLQIPANGMLVFEPIRVIGTAYTDNFAFYKLEISGPSTNGAFAVLSQYAQPVSELADLGQFVPSFYEPGEYEFQLTVFDITNILRAACMVNITISEPIPTPTPFPSQ